MICKFFINYTVSILSNVFNLLFYNVNKNIDIIFILDYKILSFY